MKQNLLLDHEFTNEGEATGDVELLPYDGTGVEVDGNTLPALPALDGQLVLFCFRDGYMYRRVEDDATGKQFTFDELTNVITFAADLPAIQLNEGIDVVYMQQAAEFNEPVTLAQAKQWIKIPSSITADDDLIVTLIRAARKKIELYTGISIISKIVTAYIQKQSCDDFELPFGPVSNVIAFTDYNDAIIQSENFNLKGVRFKKINYTSCSPFYATYFSPGSSGDGWAAYIMKQVAWLYENRGDVQETRLAPALAIELKAKRRDW